MKRAMSEQVEAFQRVAPETLEQVVSRLDAEIKERQHLKAAAMKAQRNQRKAARTGGDT